MNCLITGCSGLIGQPLADHLLSQGAKVFGTYHSGAEKLDSFGGRVEVLRCDITNAQDVRGVIDWSRPDRIFHLAAQSYPSKSWIDPEATMQTNLMGTMHLLEAVRNLCPQCQIMVFGSSAEYGRSAAQREYIDESAALEPDSPYGASKVAADLIAEIYVRAYDMHVIRVRPFFVIGPGRGWNVFVDFAQRIVNIEAGASSDFGVGNMDAVRDITDVRDAVRAIWTIADMGKPGTVYNLCSSRAHSIRDGLEMMLRHTRASVQVFTDSSRFRTLDTPRLVGSNARLRSLGWTPEISLEQTLQDILQYWRSQLPTSTVIGPPDVETSLKS
jgi:GDP-4-dehydro-6-deoxy-D-mannose reductase